MSCAISAKDRCETFVYVLDSFNFPNRSDVFPLREKPRSTKIERGSLRWAPRAGGEREGRSRPMGVRVANAPVGRRARWPGDARARGQCSRSLSCSAVATSPSPAKEFPRRRALFRATQQSAPRTPSICWVAGLVRQAEVMSFSLKPSAIFGR